MFHVLLFFLHTPLFRLIILKRNCDQVNFTVIVKMLPPSGESKNYTGRRGGG